MADVAARQNAEPAAWDQAAEEKPSPVPVAEKPRNPVRRWILVVLGVCLVLFIYHLFADRLTPYTSQAFVQAYVVGIAPEVAGPVIEVNVEDNQRVEVGQVLFRVDPRRYEVAVESAEAALAEAGQTIGASTAQVAAAEAKLTEAQSRLANIREQGGRVLELVSQGWYAAARGDQARTEIETAEAEVEGAAADLEEARQRLGPEGENNPEIRAALAALAKARLDLLDTTIIAPSEGLITNLQISTGQYATVGQPVMTFIDIRSVWITAAMRENNLGNLKPGDPAEVILDVRPGEVFKAKVESLGWGVARSEISEVGDLPTIRSQQGWLREAQRFPLRLEFIGEELPKGVRVGAQANVIVYTHDHPVVNALGWLWIRLVSVLTYVY